MTEDPIVAEIRKVRHAHAAQFNNDIAAIFADTRRQEKESGRTYVTFPPRLVQPKEEEVVQNSAPDPGPKLPVHPTGA